MHPMFSGWQEKSAVEISKFHNPEAPNADHVYRVWGDGEITLEKGGDLYGQRTKHVQAFGCNTALIPGDMLPMNGNDFGFITTTSHEDAVAARKIMMDLGVRMMQQFASM